MIYSYIFSSKDRKLTVIIKSVKHVVITIIAPFIDYDAPRLRIRIKIFESYLEGALIVHYLSPYFY